MGKYFLDCEFNSFGGDMISLALAPEDETIEPFYVVVPCLSPTAWVAENVIPVLGQTPVDRIMAARQLAYYLRVVAQDYMPHFVADWPQDIAHAAGLMCWGDGLMANFPRISYEFIILQDFKTADYSAIPHNALEDAKALRQYWKIRSGKR